ncbi:hypothetical protein [Arthrobacter methylotrophus]
MASMMPVRLRRCRTSSVRHDGYRDSQLVLKVIAGCTQYCSVT